MLSNIFLHHVLDKWFEEVARPRLRGNCQLVRYADDFVVALEDRHSGRPTSLNREAHRIVEGLRLPGRPYARIT